MLATTGRTVLVAPPSGVDRPAKDLGSMDLLISFSAAALLNSVSGTGANVCGRRADEEK